MHFSGPLPWVRSFRRSTTLSSSKLNLVGEILIAVGALADREIAPLALVALAADDREGHDDAVADLEFLVLRAHLDHVAHELVAHDVAGLHTRNKCIVEVEVGAADRGARDLDDGIARMLDPRIGDTVAPDILFPVPAQSPL